MRVMTQNVLLGGDERFDSLCAVLSAAQPDVLVLQECVGWEDGKRLRALARALNIPEDDGHIYLAHSNPRGSGKRYHQALLSRLKIQQAGSHTDSVAHSILAATLSFPAESPVIPAAPLRLFAAHLAAANEDQRLAEVDVLLSHLLPELQSVHRQPTAAVIVAGDLNSLSPQDPYSEKLGQQLARLGITKYGQSPRFDVLRRLLATGLIDSLQSRRPGQPWVTAVRGRRDGGPESDEPVHTRTDYVLLSPSLAARLVGCGVVDVQGASDHHAVYADLDLRPTAPLRSR